MVSSSKGLLPRQQAAATVHTALGGEWLVTTPSALIPADTALAHRLSQACLREYGFLRQTLVGMVQKHPPSKVEAILLVAMAEILLLDTPPHAAVDVAVSLTRRLSPPHAGMVNAILRRSDREKEAILAAKKPPLAYFPAWIQQMLMNHYGRETAESIAAAGSTPPPLDLTLLKEGIHPAGLTLPNGSLRLKEAGSVQQLAGYTAGTWQVQDAAASLPATLFGENIKGQRVLDLCAAPGGKTAQLARQGAVVTAVDSSRRRLKRVQENLERLQLEARLVEGDILQISPEKPYPYILLDAPCSALGIFRRHPEVLWRQTAADITTLAAQQRVMLERAASWLETGGRLIYAVCSLHPSEGEAVIGSFLAQHSAYRRLPFTPNEAGIFLQPDGSLRTLPSHWLEMGGLDGFYICRIEKTS